MKQAALLLFIITVQYSSINAQQNASNESDLNAIFQTYSDNTKPGVAALLIKDGETIFMEGYGSANKGSNTPITTKTTFQLGEMSKQFTSLAILLLADQGVIAMEDDIRTYLPELPQYKYPITVGHLLNHSSGLHDLGRLHNVIHGSMTISSQSQALKLIAAQKTLASQPGTAFSFHEAITESILMAEIVSRATDQSFANFVKVQIFDALGMDDAFIRDDANTIDPSTAQPFQAIEGSDTYNKNEINSSVIGAINAYCSVEDLAKWYRHTTHPEGKLGKMIQKLDTPVKLSDGSEFEYYWGKMAIGREFTHPERGLPIFWNFGMQGGYGANVFRYLNQKIISVVLGSNGAYNGGPAHEMVDVFVEELYPLPANIDFESKGMINLSVQELQKFEGNYWFDQGYASKIYIKDDTLRSSWLFSKRFQTLVPLSDNTFQQYAKMEDTRLFRFVKEKDAMTLYFTYNESSPDIMKRYEPVDLAENELHSYAGIYYNAAYGSLFRLSISDGQLQADHINHDAIKLTPVIKDVFTSTSLFLNAITFLRNEVNQVIGFSIVTDGINSLTFSKVITKANP